MPHQASAISITTSDGSSSSTASQTNTRSRMLTTMLVSLVMTLAVCTSAQAQKKRRAPAGGRIAVVVDERLSAVRSAPELSSSLVQRLGRGRYVAVAGARESKEGVTFYRVVLTRRTSGWMQSDAVVSPTRAGDDARLLRLIRGSSEFDRIARARIFLDTFTRSRLRPAVLLLLGDAAAQAAEKLTRDAQRRLDAREMEAGGASVASYFLNFNGLDRYNRNGVAFVFDSAAKRFQYDGASWREIIRRHSQSVEATEARKRLDALATTAAR